MQLSTFRLLLCFIFSVGVFSACKKTKDVIPPPSPPDLTLQQLKDSVLIYTRDIYLWYNQIPATFSTTSFADPSKVMEAIRQYSIDPGFQAVDRWSFGIKQSEWNNLSAGIGSIGANPDSTGDFGISVFFRAEGDLRVRLVERQSPAGTAGIERAWRIIKINSSNNITTSNTNFII